MISFLRINNTGIPGTGSLDNQGDDILTGTDVGEQIGGAAGDDVITGEGGNDILSGATGNDTLSGGQGDDRLNGGSGDDTIDGGDGNDFVNAGSGDDVLTGGGGNDTFVFGPNSGNDRITDFSDDDTIDIGRSGANSIDDLSIINTNGGAQIDHGGGSVLVEGASADDLDASDFVF